MAGDWSDEQITELTRRWDLGESASEIAGALKVTRNAVIGKVHRLRKGGHPFKREKMTPIAAANSTNNRPKRPARPKISAEQQKEDLAMLARVRAAAKSEPKAFVPPAPVVIDATFAKPWTERSFNECAYPIGGEGADTLSCCAATNGKTYCRGHHGLMFKKPEKTGEQYVKSTARLAA